MGILVLLKLGKYGSLFWNGKSGDDRCSLCVADATGKLEECGVDVVTAHWILEEGSNW